MGKRQEFDPHARGSSRRLSKEIVGKEREVKEKFIESREKRVLTVLPKNENQTSAIKNLATKQINILQGSAGTGKTYLACTYAANKYLKGEIERIVLVRPYEAVGRSIGLRPGTTEDKLFPLVKTLIEDIELVLGKAEVEYMIAHGKLQLESLEDVRGRSYKNTVVILDEGQNADIKAMKALLTRLEETSQLIICGDTNQKDIKDVSGLEWVVNTLNKVKKDRPDYLDTEDMNCALAGIGVVTFNPEDIVRSGMTKFWTKVMDNA